MATLRLGKTDKEIVRRIVGSLYGLIGLKGLTIREHQSCHKLIQMGVLIRIPSDVTTVTLSVSFCHKYDIGRTEIAPNNGAGYRYHFHSLGSNYQELIK